MVLHGSIYSSDDLLQGDKNLSGANLVGKLGVGSTKKFNFIGRNIVIF